MRPFDDEVPPNTYDGSIYDIEDDDELLDRNDYKYIEKALIDKDDKHEIFSICYDLLTVFEKNHEDGMQKCLLWVYENNPCAHCRSRAAKLLFDHHIMPDSIKSECKFDCAEDTKNIVKTD